jgi:hypothetical protein
VVGHLRQDGGRIRHLIPCPAVEHTAACKIWASLQPWSVETLQQASGEVRELLQRTPYDKSFLRQYVGHSFDDDWEDNDPLVDYTIIALADAAMRPQLTLEEQEVVSARAHGPGRAADCASKLISDPTPG